MHTPRLSVRTVCAVALRQGGPGPARGPLHAALLAAAGPGRGGRRAARRHGGFARGGRRLPPQFPQCHRETGAGCGSSRFHRLCLPHRVVNVDQPRICSAPETAGLVRALTNPRPKNCWWPGTPPKRPRAVLSVGSPPAAGRDNHRLPARPRACLARRTRRPGPPSCSTPAPLQSRSLPLFPAARFCACARAGPQPPGCPRPVPAARATLPPFMPSPALSGHNARRCRHRPRAPLILPIRRSTLAARSDGL